MWVICARELTLLHIIVLGYVPLLTLLNIVNNLFKLDSRIASIPNNVSCLKCGLV